jgi:hypothetical protein
MEAVSGTTTSSASNPSFAANCDALLKRRVPGKHAISYALGEERRRQRPRSATVDEHSVHGATITDAHALQPLLCCAIVAALLHQLAMPCFFFTLG